MNRRSLFGLGMLPWMAKGAIGFSSVAELTRPENQLAVYARMRGNGVGGARGIWWISGTIYAKQLGAMAVPMIGMSGVSLNAMAAAPGGGLQQSMEEAGYFTDLATGAIIGQWKNPFTGDMRPTEPYRMAVQQIIRGDGMVERPPNPKFPMEVSGGLSRVQVSGDTVWIEENTSAKVPLLGPSAPGRPPAIVAGKSRVIDNLATFQSRVDDLLTPMPNFVPATLAYQETDPWFPWMGMGDREGLQVWQLKGRKLRGLDELPMELAQRLKADHPDFGA